MHLSALQWLIIVLLDVATRAGYMFITSFNIINVIFALLVSALHLTLLILVNYIVMPFQLAARAAVAVTLAVTNLLFAVTFVLFWIVPSSRGRVTACVNNECSWIDGSVTWIGVQHISGALVAQLAINLVPVLAVFVLGSRQSEKIARR
jgi:hypothetical protein